VEISEQLRRDSSSKKLKMRKMSVLVLMSTWSKSQLDKNKKEVITSNLNRKDLLSQRRKVILIISPF